MAVSGVVLCDLKYPRRQFRRATVSKCSYLSMDLHEDINCHVFGIALRNIHMNGEKVTQWRQ